MDTEKALFALVFAAVGGVVIAAGVRQRAKQLRLDRDGIRVTGWVHRLDHHRSNGYTVYTPIIGFRDGNGIEHKFRLKLSDSDIKYPEGSEVPLRYLPGRPDVVDLDTRNYRFWSHAVPFGVGGIFAGLGLVLFLYEIFLA